jgi:hypothetical protein
MQKGNDVTANRPLELVLPKAYRQEQKAQERAVLRSSFAIKRKGLLANP